jgi:ABC-2 type transport system ATP-binding protein
MPPLLRAEGLSFSYGARHVFTMWSAELQPGVAWLQGPNGSGKSTLLKLLAGALDPFTGRRVAAGIDESADPQGYRRQVFWCGPGAPAFSHLGAPEFFAFMAGLYPTWSAPALAEAVQGLQLTPFLAPRIEQLSSGNQRKAWLAAALAVGTPVVLLDEPFNALDAASLAWLRGALRARARAASQAWLVASHEEPVPGGPQSVLRLSAA